MKVNEKGFVSVRLCFVGLTLFWLGLLSSSSNLAAIPECAQALHGSTSLVETDEYFLELGSAAGAVGDVVAVPVVLHSQLNNPGWIALNIALCHDPEIAELVGSPRYTPELLAMALTVDFHAIDADNPSLSNPVGHGLDMHINFLRAAYNARFPSDAPLQLMTLFYRIKGHPGQTSPLSFCDGVLKLGNGPCRYTAFHMYTAEVTPGWDFFSTRNAGATFTVLEGPATHPDPPPEPPAAKVYDDLPADEAIDFRVRIDGGAALPGDTGVPVELYATADVEFTGLLLSVDFDERYLRISRVERHIQPGNNLIDNRNDTAGAGPNEGHAIITNVFGVNSYRLAAEGEEVHVATLYFDVLESVAEISETKLSVVPVTDYRGLEYKPFIIVRHRNGLDVSEPPVESQVKPISIRGGLLKIVANVATFIRGDANGDSRVDISDAMYTLGYLFLGGGAPLCPDAADANDDGEIGMSDAVKTLGFLFTGEAPLPPPSGAPGEDPTPDGLGRCLGSKQ